MTPRPDPRSRAGFTLIELLAVVTIIGLIAAVAYPNLGRSSTRTLHAQAEQIAADLELARQRAVMTGAPHRLQIDLVSGITWLEWRPPPDSEEEEAEASAAAGVPEGEPQTDGYDQRIRADTPIDLSPPRRELREFEPVPGAFGRRRALGDGIYVDGVETSEGWLDGGRVRVGFEADGSAEPSEIVLANQDGDALVLVVAPLAGSVRIE